MKQTEKKIITLVVIILCVTVVTIVLYPFLLNWAKEGFYWNAMLVYLVPIIIGNALFGLVLMWIGAIFSNRIKMISETPHVDLKICKVYTERKENGKLCRRVDFVLKFAGDSIVTNSNREEIKSEQVITMDVYRKSNVVTFFIEASGFIVITKFKIYMNFKGEIKFPRLEKIMLR